MTDDQTMRDAGRKPTPHPSGAPARRWRPWALLAVALALGGGAWAWRDGLLGPRGPEAQAGKAGQNAAPGRGGPAPVKIAAARKEDVPLYKTALGSVQAFNTVTVKSRVDGQLTEVLFTEGQMVKAGDVLARIDPRPYQAAYDQALAKKTQDESQRANAQVDLARYQQLSQREFASRQQLDTQAATVQGLTAQIAGDQALIDSAKTQLDYTTIIAPIAGRTGFRLVDQGNIVRAGDASGIVAITQIQPIATIFFSPETDLRDISAAKARGDVPVSVLAQDGQSETETGRLALIDNSVDESTGSIKLKAEFANTDGALWPGQSVTVELRYDTLRDVTTVPADAIERSQSGLYVYVLKEDETVDMRTVEVGVIARGVAVVRKGLQPGEKVVVAGQYRLAPGAKVRVGDEKTADAKTEAPKP